MCTLMASLPKHSRSAGQRTAKKRSLVLSLKPCPDDKTYYRFRLLAFSSDGKNDRDDPHITRWVHQIWGKNPEKGFPVIEDEIVCPVTPFVNVDGDRYHACKICDVAQKYFLAFKESGWKDREAGRKNKTFSRKFQGIVPVYVVNDPNYDGNNGKFKVLIFNNKKEYQEFRSKIEKQLLKTPVFNGRNAVDLCIHVGEETKVYNEGQPNESTYKTKVWDKVVFSTKAYDIPSINEETCSSMGFDEEYYYTSTPEEINAFYKKYCTISNDDIPEDDEIPVYKPEPVVSKPTNTKLNLSSEDTVIKENKKADMPLVDDLAKDPDDVDLDVIDVPSTTVKREGDDSSSKSDDIDADDLLSDLGL